MDFHQSEFEGRLKRTQSLMVEQKLDALFFTTEPEIRYFTGFRSLFWQSPTRPWFLIVPASGKPIAVIPEIGAELMHRSWLDDIRTWSSPDQNDDGVSLLASTLFPFGRIGLMMGRESQLRMALNDFDRLRDGLRGSEFVDSSDLVKRIRFVKSEAEIETINEICGVASNAFDRAPSLFNEGQSLDDVFRTFKIELLAQGAEDVPYLVGGAGRNGYGDVISPPGNAPLCAGDVLMLDTGSTLRGYFCDFDRNFSIGAPSDVVQRANETLWQATEAGLKAARPGATCSEVFLAMQSVIDQTGSNVGRYGHGLGLQLTETPSLIDWDDTPMEVGAVMTLQPSMALPDGKMMVHEENIVIRDGPPQLLTKRAAREIVRF